MTVEYALAAVTAFAVTTRQVVGNAESGNTLAASVAKCIGVSAESRPGVAEPAIEAARPVVVARAVRDTSTVEARQAGTTIGSLGTFAIVNGCADAAAADLALTNAAWILHAIGDVPALVRAVDIFSTLTAGSAERIRILFDDA